MNMMFSCSSSNPVKLTKVAIKVQSFVNSCCSIRMVIEESKFSDSYRSLQLFFLASLMLLCFVYFFHRQVSKGPIGPKEGLVFVVDDIKR